MIITDADLLIWFRRRWCLTRIPVGTRSFSARSPSFGEFTLVGAPAGELTIIPIPVGPSSTREQLLAGGTRVQVSAERPSDLLVLVVL